MFRRREPCILYLDDGFGYKELAPELERIGYRIVCHQQHHEKRQGVKDEEIIPLCAKEKWLLTTTDKNMVLRHRDLLKKYSLSLVFTSNNQEKYEIWLHAFTIAKAKIERTFRKKEPPWVGRLHPSGDLEVFSLYAYVEYQADSVKKRLRRKPFK